MKTLIILSLLVLGFAMASVKVNADAKTVVCEGLQKGSPSVQCDPANSDKILSDTIDNILKIFSFAIGALSVIMIIIGGFRYVVSGGDSAGIESAKNTILYAIIGLVIAFLARPIIVFVISRFI